MDSPAPILARRAIGAMFFTVFGAAWLILWSQRTYGIRSLIIALIVLAAAAIFSLAYRQYQANNVEEPDSPERQRANKIFNIVNVTQWVAILVVGNVLANIGLGVWVLPAAILIIGLHFFPLAKAFDNPALNFTGGAMALLAIVYPFVAPNGPANTVGCLGSGLILWASALRSIVQR